MSDASRSPWPLGLVGLGLLLGACGSGGGEIHLPPQTLTEDRDSLSLDEPTAPSELAALPEVGSSPAARNSAESPASIASNSEAAPPLPDAPPAEAADRPASSRLNDRTVVISAARTEGELTRQQLLAASVREKSRREQASPVAVVTNENLAESAAGGQLTVAVVVPERPDPDPDAVDTAPAEEYWRGRALEARIAWRDALDRVEELQTEVATLRRRFYAEDDPYYRDNEIKPAWDRALENLEHERANAQLAQDDLGRVLEEGRRAGALPGWLREGLDLEPRPEERGAQKAVDPLEPEIVDEDAWNEEP